MARRFDKLDKTLGRLVFRSFGYLCALVALLCLYLAYRYATDWFVGSFVPPILFGLVGIAAGSVIPYCFSQRRSFTEALDAMEGSAADLPRRPRD